ncbi:MAG: DUF1738 domain-containing protein, partial [Ignavibacteriales bacterium]|nr:DUF1738 domain-containing protein [Ignavibacteriales bacterium]
NFISKHFYRGINSFILRGNQFPSNFYLTFLQCKQKNGEIWNILEIQKIKYMLT